jgi:hypothetical protein
MIPRGTTFEFEYLSELEMKIKNILGHELGAHMRLIHKKNQRPKISCYCTFNNEIMILLCIQVNTTCLRGHWRCFVLAKINVKSPFVLLCKVLCGSQVAIGQTSSSHCWSYD